MQGVERLLEGRTGFIIAHRLSTVMSADVVFVLDGGRIVESGDPSMLLSDPSTRFAGLARAQLIPENSGASVSELRGARALKGPDRGPDRPGTEGRPVSLRALSARWHSYRASNDNPG
jgi:ABC-type multidrug transport system ATPase subunit